MTLEEVNKKINFFNEGLEKFISECQLFDSFDESKLRTMSTAIDRIILNDPTIRKILETGTVEQRKEYTDAIKIGIERTKRLIEDYGKTETDVTRKSSISNAVKNSNSKTSKTFSGLEKIDNDDKSTVYSDTERYRDLEDKIQKAKNGMVIASKFDKVKNALAAAGKPKTVDEAINFSKMLEDKFEDYKMDSENIKKIETINFPEMIKKYQSMKKDPMFDINDKDTQELLKNIQKSTKLIDYVDKLDITDKSLVKLDENMPKDLKNVTEVDKWISELETKIKNPVFSKKVDANSSEYKEFIKERKELLKEQFIYQLNNSPVHKNLYDGDFDDIAKVDFDENKMKKYLELTTKALQSYKAVEGKDKADLQRYVSDAEKLLKSYEVTCSSPNNITINGKTRKFSDGIDMTDENRAKDALEEIKALPKDDEFRKEIEGEAKALAGVRPTDRWYHRVLSFITFRRYMTPEDKYLLNLETKRKEVVSNLIKDNKEQRDEAKKDVDNDKGIFKKLAREFVMRNPDKKIDRKKIQRKREELKPLTR